MPDFSLESAVQGVVCGVDEAGRGPLCGPVTAGAAILDRDRLPEDLLCGLNDSKKLSAPRRDALFERLLHCAADGIAVLSVAEASVEEIDSINILRATHLAMRRAVEGLGVVPALALVDGNQPPPLACPVQCVVKGDGLSLSIAAASILAKVSRDRLMLRLAEAHPGYGWERNMGYGTAEHRAAIRSLGPTVHHRRSFGGQGRLFDPA